MTTSATSWRVEGKSGVLLCNSVCITGYNEKNPLYTLYMHVCTLSAAINDKVVTA